jgi:hypothetical protein
VGVHGVEATRAGEGVGERTGAGAEVGDAVAGWGGEGHSRLFTFLWPLDGRSTFFMAVEFGVLHFYSRWIDIGCVLLFIAVESVDLLNGHKKEERGRNGHQKEERERNGHKK